MSAHDLLIEIGTEELPPKALSGLSAAFEEQVCIQFKTRLLRFQAIQRFATPRRLALLVSQLQESQADVERTRLGPAVQAAFDDDGNPTPAAAGFARSCGVEVNELQRSEKDGIEKLSFTVLEKGISAKNLIPEIVNQALAQLPIPKPMRWGSSRTEFVRPVHWVILLLDDEIIDCTVLGIASGGTSRGHRFHCNEPIRLSRAADYESVLANKGKIVAGFDKRREMIRELVIAEGERANARSVIDEALLDEVTALVEFPVALTGKFESEYLNLPQEALILAMKSHQKYFYMVDDQERLLPKFITISNLVSEDPGQVIEGNERVIRPRLADARFFFDTDKQTPLESRYSMLENLVFQDKLGTVKDKCERVSRLACGLANKTGADIEQCQRAARLSKCDLLTRMVGEFADLQGVMGYHYALHDNEPEAVAIALYEQYLPRFAGDSVPASETGALIAIADKLDSIVGLFGIGQPPTGSKDPFALRRAAIGILRIIIERAMPLDLVDCIADASAGFDGIELEQDTASKVFDFLLDRFRAWYTGEGISSGEFQSVFELKPARPLDFHQRVLAVHHFSSLPEAAALAAANKRVANILSRQTSGSKALAVDEKKLLDEAETRLFELLVEKEIQVEPLFESGNYNDGLQALATMKDPVDRFFDEVLVMADDESIKQNRLALLQRLQKLFLRTADISQLHKT